MQNEPTTGTGEPLWTVGVPIQTTIPDKTRGFVPAWDVPVIMFDKSSFVVTIPADKFHQEGVQSAIEEAVNHVIAVRSLKGPTY